MRYRMYRLAAAVVVVGVAMNSMLYKGVCIDFTPNWFVVSTIINGHLKKMKFETLDDAKDYIDGLEAEGQ